MKGRWHYQRYPPGGGLFVITSSANSGSLSDDGLNVFCNADDGSRDSPLWTLEPVSSMFWLFMSR